MPKHRTAAPPLRGAPSLLMTACLAFLPALPATAADAAAETHANPSYQVPAGPLADALNQFAAQAGLSLVFEPGEVAGRRSAGLNGHYAVDAGFAQLLVGSGLEAVRKADGSYSLRKLPEGAVVLPAVRVTGDARTGADKYRAVSSSAALFSDTPLIEVPFSVGVYNEELIEDQRAFTLKDVLQNDPSVSVQMPGGFYGVQNFGSRGFRVDNFNGYRIDGLPFINTVSASIDDKSRVELLKGPAALRFGFMPPGGAINLVRKRPEKAFTTTLQADIDTFGSLYSQVDLSDTVAGDTLGYRVVLAGDSFDSFYDKADGDRLAGSLFAEWKASQQVTLWTSVGAQSLERSGYYGPMITANGAILDTGVKTNIMQDWTYNRHKILDAAIGSDIALNENWKLRASFNHQDTERESRLTYPYSVEDNGDYTEGALITNGPFEWKSTGGHVHLEGEFNTAGLRHDVVIGAQHATYESSGQRSFPDVGPNNAYQLNPLPIPAVTWGAAPGKFEYQETGFFATDTIAFSKQFSVLLGARYGEYENTYEDDPASNDRSSSWSPALALMYAPVEGVHSYVTYTRGLQDGGYDADTFEPLGVQKSEQWEAGAKVDLMGGRMTGEVAIFQIEQDLAIADPSATDRFSGLQRHRGIELALRGAITDHLDAGIATMYLDAEQINTGDAALDGKRPQYVPEYQVNAWGELAVPQLTGLSLTARARVVDGQYLDQTEQFEIGRYWVFDLGGRYRFKANDNDWTLRLNIENVFDRRYFESGEFYPGDAGYLAYGAPASATFSVAVRF